MQIRSSPNSNDELRDVFENDVNKAHAFEIDSLLAPSENGIPEFVP